MSYELTPVWEAYYKETDQEKRRGLLEDTLASPDAADDGADTFRKQLFEERYPAAKPGSDAFLMRCLYQLSLFAQKDALFTAVGRDTRKTGKLFHLDKDSSLADAEKNALYWELRNAARCYLARVDSKEYGRQFFGLKRLSEEEKHKKACRELWEMSRGSVLYAGEGKRLALFSEAFHDELMDFDASLKEYYDEIDWMLVRTLP